MQRILIFALAVCSTIQADTIQLKTGRTVEGTYLGGDSRNVRFDDGDRVRSYSINDISEIRFGPAEKAVLTPVQEPAKAPLQPEPVKAPLQSRPAEVSTAARASSNGAAEVPAGTAIVVRLIDDVDSQRDSVGQTFKASLDEPVMAGERTLIPRNADVLLKLTEDKQSGKISGKTELTLDVVSVQVNGRMVDVDTQEVSRASGSRTSKSGQVIGGGTALGAIIGAIAGGGKGAAIGAISGAAAGGAVQVMTKGEKVKIPSETRLTFTLQQPLHI
jgi:hypothetical protein